MVLTAFFGLCLSSSSSDSESESLSSRSDISYVCIGDNCFSGTFFGLDVGLFPGSIMLERAVGCVFDEYCDDGGI